MQARFSQANRVKRYLIRTALGVGFVMGCFTFAHRNKRTKDITRYHDGEDHFIFKRRERLATRIRTNDRVLSSNIKSDSENVPIDDLTKKQKKEQIKMIAERLEQVHPSDLTTREMLEKELAALLKKARHEKGDDPFSDVTVIFLHDWGMSGMFFKDIQDRLTSDPALANLKLTTITYDRYGYGFSDDVKTPKHMRNQAIELLEVLKTTNTIPKKQIVLVSVGYGNTIAYLFQNYFHNRLPINWKQITVNPLTPEHATDQPLNEYFHQIQTACYHPILSSFGLMEWILRFSSTSIIRKYFIDRYNGTSPRELQSNLCQYSFAWNWISEYKSFKSCISMLSETDTFSQTDSILCLPTKEFGSIIWTPKDELYQPYHEASAPLFKTRDNIIIADERYNHINIHKSQLLYDEIVAQIKDASLNESST